MLITPDKFSKALDYLRSSDLIALDVETYWIDDYSSKLIIGTSTYCQLPDGKMLGMYFPFRHEKLTGYGSEALLDCNLDLDCLKVLADVLNSENITHLFHNAKFDRQRYAFENAPLTQPFYCTMVMSHMWDENNSHKLEDLAERFRIDPEANARQKHLHALRKKIVWHKIDVDLMAEYAVGDVRNTYNLYHKLKAKLEAQNLWPLVDDQMAYSDCLMQMEMRGIRIDKKQAIRMSDEAELQMREIVKELGFDPGKALDLAQKLFIDLKLPVQDRGKPTKQFPEGRPTMNEATLAFLGKKCPNDSTVKLVLEYRGLQKARSTWYEGWYTLSDSNGRLHTTFSQHGTVTTRLSSSGPNVHQIPREAEDAAPVKKLLRATSGYELWEFDYSQLEYRIIATYCQQPDLIQAYLNGSDFHTLTSNKLSIPRHLAKNVNFTLAYLGGPGALHQYIPDADMLDLKKIHSQFHRDYAQLVATAERANAKAARHGFVKLWTGHRCRFEIFYETKKAWNRIVQGGGAQIVRVATVKIMRDPELNDCFINSNVHDALWVEIPKGMSQYRIPQIIRHMEWPSHENISFWKIPYLVDYKQLA